MNIEVVNRLVEICGQNGVLTAPADVAPYLYDETELFVRPQACEDCVVARPKTYEQVSAIMKMANETLTPVIPRGGGTGACGAAIPTQPSVIMLMERFRDVVEIDETNMMITVQAGVTLKKLTEVLEAETPRLYFACHPGDEGAHVGGMAIENAGGARAVKYGIMRNHIKGMKVCLPNGEIVQLGGKLIKNNMGLDLMHLCIGSEGILCVVLEVTLKLQPRMECYGTLVCSFATPEEAVKAASEVQIDGIVPLGVEYMDREIALGTAKALEKHWPMDDEGTIDIIFMLEEANEDILYENVEKIAAICDENGSLNQIIAESAKDQRNILEVRSEMYEVYKAFFVDSLDTAVPVQHIGDWLKDVDEIAEKYGTKSPRVGHVADGNFHNQILLVDGKVPEWADDIRADFYKAALKYGGTVTAEHGTGKTRKSFMPVQFSETEIEIMKNIKRAFDPNNILNPGVIVDL